MTYHKLNKLERARQRANNWMIAHEGDVAALSIIGLWLSTWALLYFEGR